MSKHDRWYSNPTQRFWACKALIEGREISHETEISEVKGWRLAAICCALKKEYGWPIVAVQRGPEAIAYYRLRPEAYPAMAVRRVPRLAGRGFPSFKGRYNRSG